MSDHASAILELQNQVRRRKLGCQVRADHVTRILYSTDGSIYEIPPLGVAFPETLEDLDGIVQLATGLEIPLISRGAGTGLAGQAIGAGLILDCSRYLTRIEAIHPEERLAIVQPGVILDTLNRAALPFGLQFGPDPASAERATIGGSLGNNASGAHSITYGMSADHVVTIEAILADGSIEEFKSLPVQEAQRIGTGVEAKTAPGNQFANLYRAALEICKEDREAIRMRWPRVWRRASGYNLNYLLPWSPSSPPQWSSAIDLPYPPVSPGEINLAQLFAGSEGTLGVIRRATVRLVPLPAHTVLAVLPFPDIPSACDAVPGLLEQGPSAVELIPNSMIELARSLPAYAGQIAFLGSLLSTYVGKTSLLVVEFAGESQARLVEKARLAAGSNGLVAEAPALQKQVWAVRKVGLGILNSRPGNKKPISFIEDLAVPVEELGQFVRRLEAVFSEQGVHAEIYAHASAGCLHIRPLIDLKSSAGVTALREIASHAVELTLSLNGSVSGEHGNGLARSEWLEREFGSEITTAFRKIKTAADPKNLLNPGKIVDPAPMDQNLRYGADYQAEVWTPVMSFPIAEPNGGNLSERKSDALEAAIDLCNGSGVCRKSDGVMCPSFQALQEEMHSTRGRANLLRAMISGKFPTQNLAEKAVKEALDLCLACKGCRAECPTGVDMAKIKYEFIYRYYSSRRRPLRDYLFGYIDSVAKLGSPFAPLANVMLKSRTFTWAGEKTLGLSGKRSFPHYDGQPLSPRARMILSSQGTTGEQVLFLSDAFSEYFYPQAGLAAIQALIHCGCRVVVLPVLGAGRTLISKGFLEAAHSQAIRLMAALRKLDPDGHLPVVGVEPSEIFTLRDEYLDLLPNDPYAQALAKRAYMIDEFLIRPGDGQSEDASRLSRWKAVAEPSRYSLHKQKKILLHGHCYQKAQPPAEDGYPSGVRATVAMLAQVGYLVEVIDSGCCGMAGAFGYEADHYDLSMQVGELRLFPAVRAAGRDQVIAASGVSCQAQILDGTGRNPVHPITLLD